MVFTVPSYIFLGMFVLASLFQLVFAFIENQTLRRKEKFLCLLMLGVSAIFAFPNEPLIYVGAFLGMIGDILVLRKKTFYAGSIAFLLGHLCYIFEALWHVIKFESILFWQPFVIVGSFIIVFVAMAIVCKLTTKHSNLDIVAQSIYFATQVTYIPIFIFAVIAVGPSMWLAFSGAILFIISDAILVLTHFGRKFKRYDFYIMLTYLLAEALIVSGFILTLSIAR